ncbi:TauD/TfdA family dioxygenase [Actinokineospora sp. 24-640]
MSLESVDIRQLADVDTGIALTDEERAELEILAAHAACLPGRIDDRSWVAAVRELSALLPVRLRQTLRRFTWDPGSDAAMVLRNLPVSPETMPATPSARGSVQRVPAVPSAVAALIALHLGELVAFREEKSGALVQDVVPVPGMESFQGNAGSTTLSMHVENAFHANRPDYVGLLCLRNDHDNIAGLQTACVRNALALVDESTREILHQPRFVTEAPGSFGGNAAPPAPAGILRGHPDDPDIVVDFESTRPLDDDAARAMRALGIALSEVRQTHILEPGDFAFVDNRLTLHGRTSFRPRYDGRDRWLHRVFVQLDFRSSRRLRPGNGQVIHGS